MGEPLSGMLKRILNKPRVCKGGQFLIVSDVDSIWPRSYVHRHKLWERPAGFTLEGTNDVKMILDNIDRIIIGDGHVETVNTRKIFKKRPGLFWDNYFSGDIILDHAERKVYGMLSTVRRNCLPNEFQHNTCTKMERLVI